VEQEGFFAGILHMRGVWGDQMGSEVLRVGVRCSQNWGRVATVSYGEGCAEGEVPFLDSKVSHRELTAVLLSSIANGVDEGYSRRCM